MARSSCPIVKVLLLAWRWPPELTMIWVALLPLVLLADVALKVVPLALKQAAAADHDLGRRVVVIALKVTVSPAAKVRVPLSASVTVT